MDRVPYVCLLVAVVLIYVPRFVVGAEMKKQTGGYDNHEPRRQQAALDGRGRRALGAHHNGFETFAPFAAAVLAAVQRGVHVELVSALALGFIIARAVYVGCYVADRATVRSAMWTLGQLATAALFVLAIMAS
jgi:uncharacterized MAPEG superfamily protein